MNREHWKRTSSLGFVNKQRNRRAELQAHVDFRAQTKQISNMEGTKKKVSREEPISVPSPVAETEEAKIARAINELQEQRYLLPARARLIRLLEDQALEMMTGEFQSSEKPLDSSPTDFDSRETVTADVVESEAQAPSIHPIYNFDEPEREYTDANDEDMEVELTPEALLDLQQRIIKAFAEAGESLAPTTEPESKRTQEYARLLENGNRSDLYQLTQALRFVLNNSSLIPYSWEVDRLKIIANKISGKDATTLLEEQFADLATPQEWKRRSGFIPSGQEQKAIKKICDGLRGIFFRNEDLLKISPDDVQKLHEKCTELSAFVYSEDERAQEPSKETGTYNPAEAHSSAIRRIQQKVPAGN